MCCSPWDCKERLNWTDSSIWTLRSLKLNFFSFIFISWKLITLQYCSGFCHTLSWISHGFTNVPHPDPLPTSLPIFFKIPIELLNAIILDLCNNFGAIVFLVIYLIYIFHFCYASTCLQCCFPSFFFWWRGVNRVVTHFLFLIKRQKIPFHFLNLTSLSSLIIENNTPTVSPLRCSTFPLLSSSLQQVSTFEILSLPLTFHSPLLPSFAEID